MNRSNNSVIQVKSDQQSDIPPLFRNVSIVRRNLVYDELCLILLSETQANFGLLPGKTFNSHKITGFHSKMPDLLVQKYTILQRIFLSGQVCTTESSYLYLSMSRMNTIGLVRFGILLKDLVYYVKYQKSSYSARPLHVMQALPR